MRDLPPRYARVAELVAKGKTNKQIAKALGLSPYTVRTYIQSAADLLGGSSYDRHQLTIWYLSVGSRG